MTERIYTTTEAAKELGLKTRYGVLLLIKRLGITPKKVKALNAAGFTYHFTEEQIDQMRARNTKPTGRPTSQCECGHHVSFHLDKLACMFRTCSCRRFEPRKGAEQK